MSALSIFDIARLARKGIDTVIMIALAVGLCFGMYALSQWHDIRIPAILASFILLGASAFLANALRKNIWPLDCVSMLGWIFWIEKVMISKQPQDLYMAVAIGCLWAGIKITMIIIGDYDHAPILHPTNIMFAVCTYILLLKNITASSTVTLSYLIAAVIVGAGVGFLANYVRNNLIVITEWTLFTIWLAICVFAIIFVSYPLLVIAMIGGLESAIITTIASGVHHSDF